MRLTGKILSLDLGVRTGFALGAAETEAVFVGSGSKILRAPHEPPHLGLAALADWLNKMWVKEKPALVVKEKRLTFMGFERKKTSADTMDSQIKLHGVVEALCGLFDIEFIDVPRPTICKHFIGIGNLKRKEGKLAVIKRAQLLGYIPKSCMDDDRADACALFSFAAATYGNQRTAELHLFEAA